jgi:tetratricopeptide (TPR) repeat protein
MVYKMQGHYPEALTQYSMALSILEEMGDKPDIAIAYSSIGNVTFCTGKFADAKNWFKKSLQLSRETRTIDGTIGAYAGLYRADSAMGNGRGAYANYRLYIAFKDSLNNEENTKKTVQAQMQYDFDKKEAEARAEQDKKDLISLEEKQKQKIVIASVSSGLLLVFVLVLVILKSLRQNQKKNKIITEQKELVEKQKELVEEKQKEILDSIRYARRIQRALITNETYIHKHLDRLNG